jgi:hypothetical protein
MENNSDLKKSRELKIINTISSFAQKRPWLISV